MNRDKKCPLLAKSSADKEIYQTITSAEAGWNLSEFHGQNNETRTKMDWRNRE